MNEEQNKYIELAADYAEIFATPAGERVMKDIIDKGFLESPASYPLPGKDGITLIIEGERANGRRELAHYIRQMTESLQKQEQGEDPAPDWTTTGGMIPPDTNTPQ